MLMAMLVAVGMLASFAGPVVADHEVKAENDVEINNEINQDQTSVQYSEQDGAAVAFDGDATVDQDNEQRSDQDQTVINVNEVEQEAIAAAFSLF